MGVRFLRGSRPAAALPAGVPTCCCAASAGTGGGFRKGLDRAAGTCAGLGSRAAAWARDERKVLRLLRDPVVNAEVFDLRARTQHRARLEGWGRRNFLRSCRQGDTNAETFAPTARYRWICNRRTASEVADPPMGRANAERWVKNAETKNRASPESPDQTARPEVTPGPAAGRGSFGGRPQRMPRQRTSKYRPPRGSAAASTDPPQPAHQQGHDDRRERLRSRPPAGSTPRSSAAPAGSGGGWCRRRCARARSAGSRRGRGRPRCRRRW